MDGPLDRRTLLQVGGTAAALSLAGCARLSAALGLRTQELGRVVLANSMDDPAEVDLEVLRNGTTVHEASYRLDPGSPRERPQHVIQEWRDDATAKRWVVRARTPSGDWHRAELTASRGGSEDCHMVHVVTGEWSGTDLLVVPTDCPTS